jgi:hypothetical protein
MNDKPRMSMGVLAKGALIGAFMWVFIWLALVVLAQ